MLTFDSNNQLKLWVFLLSYFILLYNYFSMTSLQKIGLAHFDSHKNILITSKVKSLSRQHSHHKSSTMFKTIVLNETNAVNFIQKHGSIDAGQSTFEKKEMRKYCINKFRVNKDQQKPLIKRKTITLNLFKRDDTQKLKAISKTQNVESIEALPQLGSTKDEKTINNLFRQIQSFRSITPKRRFQIRASKLLKIKTQTTQENQQKNNDVSFQQTLKKQTNYVEHEREPKKQLIKTQEALGIGLRKASLTKKKVLVKNPFERHKKQKKQQILNHPKYEDIMGLNEFNQSEIHKCDKSIRSMAHHQQLQHIIAMI